MRATLLRFCDGPFGVFGYLDLCNHAGQRVARLVTCEDQWLDNRAGVSCIPAGTYACVRTTYHRYGTPTFEITHVLGRSRILFHSGNTEEDTEGCVLLGQDFGSSWAVVRSRDAMREFLALLEGVETFELDVRWAAPGEWRAT